MNMVITGSASRVGSKLARRLLDEGHHVTGFDLRGNGIERAAYHEMLGAFHDHATASRGRPAEPPRRANPPVAAWRRPTSEVGSPPD